MKKCAQKSSSRTFVDILDVVFAIIVLAAVNVTNLKVRFHIFNLQSWLSATGSDWKAGRLGFGDNQESLYKTYVGSCPLKTLSSTFFSSVLFQPHSLLCSNPWEINIQES